MTILQGVRFFTGTKAWAVWSSDLDQLENAFLRGIDCEHFAYLAQVHTDRLDGAEDEAQRAAIALRVSYGIAQETLLAFIGACAQAPHCVSGWMTFYRNQDLEEVVSALNGKAQVPMLGTPSPSWKSLADCAFPDADDQTRSRYALAWRRIGAEYIDDLNLDEYNSAKHGMRLAPGGPTFGWGKADEDQPSVVRSSRFGSAFLVREDIPNCRLDKGMSRIGLNWNPTTLAAGLNLIAASLSGVVSGLLKARGLEPRPTHGVDPDTFSQASKAMERLTIRTKLELETATTREAVEIAYGLQRGASKVMAESNKLARVR